MNIGERIKHIRRQRKLSAEEVAEKLGVSVSTLYRYENSSILKIPIDVIDRLCPILGTTAGELMGTAPAQGTGEELPCAFANASDAMAFILKMPVLAAYANEILEQLKLVSYKYKK